MPSIPKQSLHRHPSRGRRFLGRLFKFVCYAAAIVVLLLILGAIALRIMFPPAKLKAIAIEKIEEALQREVSVGDVEFELLSGLSLKDIHITRGVSADSNASPIRKGSADRIVFRYRLFSLLRRKIEVDETLIEKPRVDLLFVQQPTPAPPTTETTAPPDVSVEEQPAKARGLPVSIDLKNLQISDAEARMQFIGDSAAIEVSLDGLTLILSDLEIPRGGQNQWQELAANVQLQCRRSETLYRQETLTRGSLLETHGLLSLALNAHVQGWENVEAHLSLSVEQGLLALPGNGVDGLDAGFLPPLSVTAAAVGDIGKGDYNFEKLTARVGDAILIDISGSVTDMSTKGNIDAQIRSCEIDLAGVQSLLPHFMPATELDSIFPASISGRLSLKRSGIHGALPRPDGEGHLDLDMRFTAEGITGHYADLLTLYDLEFESNSHAQLDSAGITNGLVQAGLALPRIEYALDDTTLLWAGEGRMETSCSLGRNLLPTDLDFKFSIEDLVGGNAEVTLTLEGAGPPSSWQGDGQIRISGLPVGQFLQGAAEGKANAQVDLTVRGLQDLALVLRATVDSLHANVSGETQSFRVPELLATINARMDTTLRSFWIDSSTVSLGDVFFAHGFGEFFAERPSTFSFTLQDAYVAHDALINLVPEEMLSQVGDVAITGSTHLGARLSGRQTEDSSQFGVDGRVFTRNVSVEYPRNDIRVGGLQLESTFQLDQRKTQAELAVRLDSLYLTQMRPAPILGADLSLECSLSDYDSLKIRHAALSIPDLATSATFRGSMTRLREEPELSFQTDLAFQSADTVRATKQLAMRGETRIATTLRMQENLAKIEGVAKISDVDLFFAGNGSVLGLHGELPFAQSYLTDSGKLVADSKDQFIFASALANYSDIFGDYYSESVPQLGWITADRLLAAGYRTHNLRAQVFLRSGRVEIPSILLDLYDGNFGASASVDLSQGDLAQASVKVEGHLSGINSALLAERTQEEPEQGIINANFRFSGYGLDVQKGIDLEGYFHITEIGPRVADNLLRSLDPEGRDSGIRNTRFLINHGFKPKLMSFEVKHGYFYPTMEFSQPWYFPIKLSGGKVALGRIPLGFFLEMMERQRVK